MNPELVAEAQHHWDNLDRIYKFQSRFNVFPHRQTHEVVDGFQRLSEVVPEYTYPANRDELLQSELKRRLAAQVTNLDHFFSGRPYAFDEVITSLGIEEQDIQRFRPWLQEHKPQAIDTIERTYDSMEDTELQLPLPLDLPDIEGEVIGFSRREINNYHSKLGKMLEQLTQVGGFLRDVKAMPTRQDRSYFNPLSHVLALGLPDIGYVVKDGTLHIRERQLIRLYGHEGMGHALQQIITDNADVPFFLRESSDATIASQESVTQFYETVIFEDLRTSKPTQKALGIEHKYEAIYKEEKDTRIIEDYMRTLYQYAITVLAGKVLGENLDDPSDPEVIRRKLQLINEVALSPQYARWFIDENRFKFDHEGNLDPSLVHELRYSAQPVARSLDIFNANGIIYEGDERSKIDFVFLTGFWTPVGFVQNAKLAAKE